MNIFFLDHCRAKACRDFHSSADSSSTPTGLIAYFSWVTMRATVLDYWLGCHAKHIVCLIRPKLLNSGLDKFTCGYSFVFLVLPSPYFSYWIGRCRTILLVTLTPYFSRLIVKVNFTCAFDRYLTMLSFTSNYVCLLNGCFSGIRVAQETLFEFCVHCEMSRLVRNLHVNLQFATICPGMSMICTANYQLHQQGHRRQ